MMNAIIVDDETHCSNRLQDLLTAHCREVNILRVCDTVSSGVAAIRELQPALVFLDVQLHEQTGFDLLQQLPGAGFDVIFTTAFEQYAIQAFKFSAVDYLLKPVDALELQQAVHRQAQQHSKAVWAQKMESLLHNVQTRTDSTRRLCLPTANGLFFFPVQDIIRCEAAANYTTVYAVNHAPLTVAKPLKELEALLSGPNFFRVHQSHLVNLDYIKRYKNGMILLPDKMEIEVATRRKEEFLKRLSGH